jgi:acyl transferase domain-containing protein
MGSRIVQLFPGQGSQWPGMGAELLDTSPAFGSAIDACDGYLEARTDWSIRRAFAERDASRLDGILDLQLMLFAVEMGLAAMWHERGVVGEAVAGTSLGEIAAACVAGALVLDDALAIVLARGELLELLRPEGGTVVLNVDGDQIAGVLDGLEGEAWAIGYNGPGTTTFSGREPALAELLRRGTDLGVFAARVPVDYPAHCVLLEPLAEPLRRRLTGIRPVDGERSFYSAVTGGPVAGRDLNAEYWVRNLTQPVLGGKLLDRLLDDGYEVILEVTPHPIFAKPTADAISARGASARHVPTLRRNKPAHQCIVEAQALLG